MAEANATKGQLGEILSEAQIYREYQEAFQKRLGFHSSSGRLASCRALVPKSIRAHFVR
jgi:hypothetical protein